jgi:hypothetical protein
LASPPSLPPADARNLGIARTTLERWAKGTAHPEPAANAAPKKAALADQFEAIAYHCLGLLPGKLAQATAVQLIVVAGTAIDKMQLLRGKATSINQHNLSHLSDADLDREVAAAEAALAQAVPRDVPPRGCAGPRS